MTATLGVTGTRNLTTEQAEQVRYEIWELDRTGTHWHIGCTKGVDALVRKLVTNGSKTLHTAKGGQAWQLQKRSREMVDALAAANGTLHAWVNKPCPSNLTVTSWQGSGTWGTMCYAIAKGVKVELHWLIEPQEEPDWLEQKQLSLV